MLIKRPLFRSWSNFWCSRPSFHCRLLFIKNQDLYKKVFGRAGTVASVVLLWIMVYFLDLPNALYVGLSKHRYNPTALHCDFRCVSLSLSLSLSLYPNQSTLFSRRFRRKSRLLQWLVFFVSSTRSVHFLGINALLLTFTICT